MTKNVFKIGAVVLLICMLGAVGVSSAASHMPTHDEASDAAFEVLPADFIWNNTLGGKANWTYVTNPMGDPVVFINVSTANTSFPYLSAYNVTLGGDLVAFKKGYGLLAENFDQIVDKDQNVSSTLTAGTAKDIRTEAEKLFNVTLDQTFSTIASSAINSGYKQTMKVLGSSELALINKSNPGDVNFGGFLKDTSGADSDDFELWIRKDKPDVDNFYFPDYTGATDVADGGKVYVYKEHGNISIATDKGKIHDNYDNTRWSTVGDAEYLVGITADIISDIEKNTLNFSNPGVRMDENKYGEWGLTVKVNPALNDKNGGHNVETESTVTVNVTNWNRTMTSNADLGGGDGINGNGWNFKNGLGVNYTVGAATMDTSVEGGWQTNVTINPMKNQKGGIIMDWKPKVTYTNLAGNPIDTYVINEIAGDSKFTNPVNGNTKFNVTYNGINRGESENDVIITLSGSPKGDADLDGYVDIVDSSVVGITVIRESTAVNSGNLITEDMENFIYADCDSQKGDGEINVYDVRAINRFLVGLVPWP